MPANPENILAPPGQLPHPSGQMPAGQPNIIPTTPEPPPGPQPGEMGPDGEIVGQGLEETEPTPEEQEEYDQLMYKFANYVYDKGRDKVLKSINNPDAPVHENVARTQMRIMNELVTMAEEQRGDALSPDTLFHATAEQIEILMDLGDMADIFPFDSGDEEYTKTQEMAFAEAQQMFGQGLLDSEDAEFHKQDAANIAAEQVAREADAGKLDPQYQQGINGLMQQAQPKMNPVAAGVKQGLGSG